MVYEYLLCHIVYGTMSRTDLDTTHTFGIKYTHVHAHTVVFVELNFRTWNLQIGGLSTGSSLSLGVISYWPMKVREAEVVNDRKHFWKSVSERPFIHCSRGEVYKILRVTDRKSLLVMTQHLIIIGAGRSGIYDRVIQGALCRVILQVRRGNWA